MKYNIAKHSHPCLACSVSVRGPCLSGAAKFAKVFCFFSSEKKCLLSYYLTFHIPCPDPPNTRSRPDQQPGLRAHMDGLLDHHQFATVQEGAHAGVVAGAEADGEVLHRGAAGGFAVGQAQGAGGRRTGPAVAP